MTPDRIFDFQNATQIKISPERWDQTKSERIQEIEQVAQEIFAQPLGSEEEALIAGFLKGALKLAIKPSQDFFDSPKITSVKLFDLDDGSQAGYENWRKNLVPHSESTLEVTTALVQNLTGNTSLKVNDDAMEKYIHWAQDGSIELIIEWGRRVNFKTRIPGLAISYRYITLQSTPRVVEIIPALEIGLKHRLQGLSTNRIGQSTINSNGQA